MSEKIPKIFEKNSEKNLSFFVFFDLFLIFYRFISLKKETEKYVFSINVDERPLHQYNMPCLIY